MFNFKNLKLTVFIAIFALLLVACSNSNDGNNNQSSSNENESPETNEQQENGNDESESEDQADTVEITDAHGTVTVPVNPQNVVALDNRSFETLADWGIELAAAPQDVMPASSAYKEDDSIQNIGNHREPNLEIIAAVDPELVIVGQRFGGYYEDIKALVPNATVIDLNIDVSEEASTPG